VRRSNLNRVGAVQNNRQNKNLSTNISSVNKLLNAI